MRIVFMGTPAFALPTLQALIDSTHEVVAVYCQPPRPAGRGQKPQPSPVQRLAEMHAIPVYYPTSLRDSEVQATFNSHAADAAIVAAYGLLLPPPILNAYRYGCINIHPSDLPRWRGAAPIQRTIMAGDADTAICIMHMDEGLDTGDVLLRKPLPIPANSDAGWLHDWLAAQSAPLLLEALQQLQAGTACPTQQSAAGITYASKISKQEAALDWQRPAHELLQQIRGLVPSPCAYFEYASERFKVWDAVVVEGDGIAGITLDSQLRVACGQGALQILKLQRQGKAAIAAEDMLRGYAIPAGTDLN